MKADGASVERLLDVADRPLVSVFLPDRLELIKGAPSLRRGHLDAFVAALWPARAQTRRAYAQSLAQRNALLEPPARRRGPRAGGLDARQLGRPARPSRPCADGRSRGRGRRDRVGVRAALRGARSRRRAGDRLPTALARVHARGARRRARRACRLRSRARLHRPRSPPRRRLDPASRPRAPRLRLPGPAAACAARLAAGRARGAGRAPRRAAGDAARRRHVRARRPPPPSARRPAARGRRAVGDHRDRPRAGPRLRRRTTSTASRSRPGRDRGGAGPSRPGVGA